MNPTPIYIYIYISHSLQMNMLRIPELVGYELLKAYINI